jgi:hypothetical protein
MNNIIIRVFVLLLLSFVLTNVFFSYVKDSAQHVSIFEKEVMYSSPPISPSELLNGISGIVQAPLPLMSFNIYAINNLEAIGDDLATSTTVLNIDIKKVYTTIHTGEIKLIRKKHNLYLSGLNFERSIDPSDSTLEKVNGYYVVFPSPTIMTFILTMLFIMIPLAYVFILIFSSCLRFILIGSPFSDVMTEFKNRK